MSQNVPDQPAYEAALMGRRTAWLLGTLAVSSFVFAVLATIFAPESANELSAQADPFSRSAIGQRAFVELLRRQGVPVWISRHDSGRRAGRDATLVLPGPRIPAPDKEDRGPQITRLISEAETILVVLPKWVGKPLATQQGHVASVELVPQAEPERLLSVAGVAGDLLRLGSGTRTCGGVQVALTSAQLLKPLSDTLVPLLACEDGVLLGEIVVPDGPRILVLSDPDLFSNHALPRANNVAAALAVIAQARPAGQGLIIDVTTLGFQQAPSLWRALFEFPLALATWQALLTLFAFAWAASRTLGQPLAAADARTGGQATLIETTVDLLLRGQHGKYLLKRYGEDAFDQAAHALHLPAGLARSALPEALQRLLGRHASEDARGLAEAIERVTTEPGVQPAALLAVARRVHRFRQGVLLEGERSWS